MYSDDNRLVTITLKHYIWSNGQPVSARDVIFWINLLRANREDWASYVPGGFPDNVTSATALGATTVQLRLNADLQPRLVHLQRAVADNAPPALVGPTSLARPAPTAEHDRSPRRDAEGGEGGLQTSSTARPGYRRLTLSNPIWSVVDGPWKLVGLTTDGTATFAPNRRFSGPDKPHLAKFVELPYTSCLRRVLGAARARAVGGRGAVASGDQISVGYVPDNDLPQTGALKAQGYQLVDWFPSSSTTSSRISTTPRSGRSAPALLPRGVPAPGRPAGLDPRLLRWPRPAHIRPGAGQPFEPVRGRGRLGQSVSLLHPKARALLVGHGWRVVADGITTCARPGAGADDCGEGIARGEGLNFTLMYPSGLVYTDGSMVDLQSVAKQVGIEIALKEVTPTTIASTILSCLATEAACSWQLGQYGAGWVFEPDHYPSGEEIFETGALGNVSNFSNAKTDKLIVATTRATARGPGRPRRLPGPGPSRAARLLAAEPWNTRDGPVEPSRLCSQRLRVHQPRRVVLHQGLKKTDDSKRGEDST